MDRIRPFCLVSWRRSDRFELCRRLGIVFNRAPFLHHRNGATTTNHWHGMVVPSGAGLGGVDDFDSRRFGSGTNTITYSRHNLYLRDFDNAWSSPGASFLRGAGSCIAHPFDRCMLFRRLRFLDWHQSLGLADSPCRGLDHGDVLCGTMGNLLGFEATNATMNRHMPGQPLFRAMQ